MVGYAATRLSASCFSKITKDCLMFGNTDCVNCVIVVNQTTYYKRPELALHSKGAFMAEASGSMGPERSPVEGEMQGGRLACEISE